MTESETQPGTAAETNDEHTPVGEQGREGSKLDKLRELFAEPGESSGDDSAGGDADQNAEPGKPKGKPKKFNDLAERLGLELTDLYKLEVTASKDGSPVTVEQLKDLHSKSDEITVRELEFAERVSNKEAEWTKAQQEVQALFAAIDPKAITPALRERVTKDLERQRKLESDLIAESIPEWKNDAVRNAEIKGMVESLEGYGLGSLLKTPHHKLFRYVRDNYLRAERIKKALAAVGEVKKPSTTGRSSAGNGTAQKPSANETRQKSSTRTRLLNVLN
jgi:hypothetical protein